MVIIDILIITIMSMTMMVMIVPRTTIIIVKIKRHCWIFNVTSDSLLIAPCLQLRESSFIFFITFNRFCNIKAS
jgi:hypothetical protein